MSRRNSYAYELADMKTVTSLTVSDVFNSCKQFRSDINLESFQDILTKIFNSFTDEGLVVTTTHQSSHFGCISYADDWAIGLCFEVRSSLDNTVNAFSAEFTMDLYYKTNSVDIKGVSVCKYILNGNKIIKSYGKRSIFETHGGFNDWYGIQNLTNVYGIKRLATYFKSRYAKCYKENQLVSKQVAFQNKTRQFIIDDVRSICDLINNYNEKHIYAHFYDSGKADLNDNFIIVINNRNDYEDLPKDTYLYRECSINLPMSELATIKYFTNYGSNTIYIRKENNNWIIRYDGPYMILKKLVPCKEMICTELSESYEFIENLIKKDMYLCEKMNEVMMNLEL